MKISSADEYQIVSCDMHSELELAIMHGKNLTLTLKALSTVEDKMVIQLKPTDIVTRGENTPKGEFLIGIMLLTLS